MGPKHNDAELYLRIAKKLAVDLPDETDRVLALKWIKFLQHSEELAEKKTKMHVTQLLLICLQRKRLVGPFVEAPEPNKKLLQYGWAYQPADIARLILKSEYERIGKTPFFVDISGDMCEYVATQDIPQFGAHFYYAYSPENASKWDGLNKEYIPKGFLSVSTTESPEASILASTIAQTMNQRKRVPAARIVRPEGEKKRSEFTAASMVDEMTGRLHDQFLKEVPTAKDVYTDVLQDSVKRGIIEPDDLALPSDIGGRTVQVCTGGKIKKGVQHDTIKLASPLVETVEVKDGSTTISNTQNVKNATSNKLRKKTKNLFDAIKEEEEEDKVQEDFIKKTKEQESRRQELISMMPERLRKRVLEQQKKKEKKAKEAKVKTPEVFRKDTKGIKFKRIHKPEEFGLSATEKFDDPLRVFANLEYKSPHEESRKTVWIGKDIPTAERERQLARLGLTGQSRLSTSGPVSADAVTVTQGTPPKRGASFLQRDIEASWDRSLKKMQARRAEREERADERAHRQAILDRLHRLKTVQPRRIIFDDMDVQVEPEEVSFKKFVFSELPDEDKTPSILEDTKMEFEDIFGEGQIASVSHLEAPLPIEELEKAELLLETEMVTDDVFGQEDVADPSVVFKEVAIEGERLVSPTQRSKSPREGGVKIGKRVLEIPGQMPMEQHYMEPYGDVVYNESLKAIDPALDPRSHTPLMNDEILNRYLDQKLKTLKPGESPRVHGPWAQSFKKDLERLERGEELDDFPEEDAAKYVYPHIADKSILSESDMDTSDAFGKDKTAIPSPILLAEARRQSDVYSKLKDTFEVKKARKIQKALAEQQDEQDLLEPYIYDSWLEDRKTLLDASITDAGLGLALVEAPETPVKTNPLESFEKKLDESLALLATDDREDEPALQSRIVYDEDFLNKKIQNEELPEEDSIIEDIDVDDVFGEGNFAEPLKIKEIPEPPKLKSPPKPPSPVRHSHLYLPQGKYRSKVEDIVSHDFLDEQSFPEDKFLEEGYELSPAESSVSEITPPSFVSSVSDLPAEEGDVAESPSEGDREDDGEGYDTPYGILDVEDMPIEDVFGADRIKTPSPVRRISPTTLALAKSIQQTRNVQKIINKYRETLGLAPQKVQVPVEGVAQYLEARESLLDPLVQEEIREPFPGIIDEPILEDDLDKPLVTSPVKKDFLADYEKKMMDEILEERAAQLQDVDVLPEDEMVEDIFAKDQISVPPPIQELPMPSPRKSVKAAVAPTPLEHSHLFLMKPPLKPIVKREPPPEIPEEKLEDEPEPELEPLHELSSRYELSSEDQEVLKMFFDGEIPSSMKDDLSFHIPEEEDLLEAGGRSGYSPIMERFHQLKDRNKSKTKERTPPRGSLKAASLDWLSDKELDTDDVFGEGQIIYPRQVQKSPTLLILERSIRMSKDLLALKNKFRAMKNQPPIEEAVDTHHVDQIKQAEEALRHVLVEPPVDERQTLSKALARGKKILERIEKQIEESEQRKAEEKEPSFIGSEELSDLFEKESIAEPPPLKEIPMPTKLRTPSPPPPVKFSHLEMPQKYRLPLPHDVPEEDLTEEEFPEDIPEEILGLVSIGFEAQLEAEEEPSFEEPPPLQRPQVLRSPRQSAFFDRTPPQDDLYYNLLRSPEGWRQPIAIQAINRAIKDSQTFASLRNKFRVMKNLPPIEEDRDQNKRLLQLAESALQQQHIAENPPSPSTPRRFTDLFQTFEKDIEKELYPSPPPPERSLISEADIEDAFGEAQVLTPPHIKDIPIPYPKPSPVKTPSSLRTPSPRRLPSVRVPSPVKPYRPELASILPHEQILEQSFPSADESVLEYLPSPKIADIPPPDMIDDAELPAYDEPSEEEGDVLEEAEMPTDDMFGEDRVLSPERIAVSPTQFILARSLRVSEDYRSLKNKIRAMRGLPPVEEPLHTKHLREYLDQTANLLDPLRSQILSPERFSLMDEPVLETQPVGSLISPPRKKDLFADYERQLNKELYPSPPPPERSLLGEGEFEDYFTEDAIATPSRIRSVPVSSSKASPFLTPKSPQTPPCQLGQHYLNMPATKVVSPPSNPYETLLYDDPQILQETPPEFYAKTGLDLPISPMIAPLSPSRSPRISAPVPGINVRHATATELTESPMRSPSPHRVPSPPKLAPTPKPSSPTKQPSPSKMHPSLTPEVAYIPIQLDFKDDIGPPSREDSPGLIRFRETLPGVFEPARDVDKKRFEERGKNMLANKFGISPEAIPNELLQEFSPPKLDASLGSPELEAHMFDDDQMQSLKSATLPRVPLPDTPKLRRSAKASPKQLFSRKHLSSQLSPHERMKQFLAQQPIIQVEPLPRKTGLSPQDFVTKVLPPREENLEEQEFPLDDDYRPSLELGPLASALFYPTEKDILEAENLERQRAERFRTPPGFKYATPPPPQTLQPPPEDMTPVSPIVAIPDVLPHERGFKWLENYQPFPKELVPAELLTMQETPPPEKFPNKKWNRLNSEQVAILRQASEIKKKRQSGGPAADFKSPEKKMSVTKASTKKSSQKLIKPTLQAATHPVPDKPSKLRATPRSSPLPPPGTAIKRHSQQYKQPTPAAEVLPVSDKLLKPSLPGKPSGAGPMKSLTKTALPVPPKRGSIPKTPQDAPLTSTLPPMRRTPGSAVQTPKTQSIVKNYESAPKRPPTPKLSTPSVQRIKPSPKVMEGGRPSTSSQSKQKASSAPLSSVATMEGLSKPTVQVPKTPTRPLQQTLSTPRSQPSVQKPKPPPRTAASGRKSQVTFKSPLVPHWQLSPRLSQPFLQAPGFRLSGILKTRPKSPATGQTSMPTHTSVIAVPVAKSRRAPQPGQPVSTKNLPIPPPRSSIPKPLQRSSTVAVAPFDTSSLPSSAALGVEGGSQISPSTGAYSLRGQPVRDIDYTAGPSNWVWQAQRSPIQAKSFRYKVPSTTPFRPSQQHRAANQVTEQHPPMDTIINAKPIKNKKAKKQKVKKAKTIVEEPLGPLNVMDSSLWAYHEEQKAILESLDLKLKQPPPPRPKRVSRFEQLLSQLEEQVKLERKSAKAIKPPGAFEVPNPPKVGEPLQIGKLPKADELPKDLLASPRKRRRRSRPQTLLQLPPGMKPGHRNVVKQVSNTHMTNAELIQFLEEQAYLRSIGLGFRTPPESPVAKSKAQIIKIKTPTTQALLKKSSVVRKTGAPPPRPPPIGQKPSVTQRMQDQQPTKPIVDRRTLRQTMTVGKVGKQSAVRKDATIEMQHDTNKPGGKMMKTNVLRSTKPGEVKKVESKFAMSYKPKPDRPDHAPQPPPRKMK